MKMEIEVEDSVIPKGYEIDRIGFCEDGELTLGVDGKPYEKVKIVSVG